MSANKLTLVMLQITFLLLGMFVINSWSAPSKEVQQETYLHTCQISCGLVSNDDEARECRENFCSNYVDYLLTGYVDKDAKPTIASSDRKEVSEFCATWLVHLIEQFGWQYRLQLNLKECVCAAGKNCLV